MYMHVQRHPQDSKILKESVAAPQTRKNKMNGIHLWIQNLFGTSSYLV